MDENFLQKLKNILLSYSTRNITVGYCQGMNFLVARLLLLIEDEEQVFWLFVQIIEEYISFFNYQELTGIIIDTTLIETLISYYLPELNTFLTKKDILVTTSNFIHKSIVCLFSQILNKDMLYTLYDFFFIDGFISMIKACIFILASIQQEVLKKESFAEINTVFNNIENIVSNPRSLVHFLYQKKFNYTQNDIINFRKKLEVPIINKIKTSELTSSVRRTAAEKKAMLKRKNINCDPNWPFCLYEPSVFDLKEIFIVKENKTPFIINDYYYIKNITYEEDSNEIIDGIFEKDKTMSDNILIERRKHICDDQKIVDISKNFGKIEKVYSNNENKDKPTDKSQEMKVYEIVRKSKDVDSVIRYIKEQLSKKDEKIIKKNEIEIINEKYKDNNYYPKNYYNVK